MLPFEPLRALSVVTAQARPLLHAAHVDVQAPGQVWDAATMLVELRRALDEHEFRLHYQPIADPRTGEIMGAEALIRWQHPVRGLLSPADFLDAADRSPYAAEIAEWVAATAIAECARWPDWWFVSINISPRQLLLGAEAGLRDTLAGLLELHDIPAERLWLELTEQGLLNEAQLVALLGDLSTLGLSVAVDDFGKGSASLGRLRQLPFKVAKIDRALLGDPTDAGSTLILRLVIELARACGCRVVVEGVETDEQLELLRELGCDLAQGYHLARPMQPEALRLLAGSVVGEPPDGTHLLRLYEDHAELVGLVTEFVEPALRADASVVLVTRQDRSAVIAEELRARGLDPDALRAERRLVDLDVEQIIEAILAHGRPDEEIARALTAEIVDRTAPGRGPLRIYGDLAPLLWERGLVQAALEVEWLCHHADDLPPHILLCAYPTAAFERAESNRSFGELRALHHRALPSGAGLSTAAATGQGETALVQQELRWVRGTRVGPGLHG